MTNDTSEQTPNNCDQNYNMNGGGGSVFYAVPQQSVVYYPEPQVIVVGAPQQQTTVSVPMLVCHIVFLLIVSTTEIVCSLLFFGGIETYLLLAGVEILLLFLLILDIAAVILRNDYLLIAASAVRFGIVSLVFGGSVLLIAFFMLLAFAFSEAGDDVLEVFGIFILYIGLPVLVYLTFCGLLIFTMFKLCANFAAIRKEKLAGLNQYNHAPSVEMQAYSSSIYSV